jgi:hypothetical protein
MTEAEKLFNETFAGWFLKTSIVSNFRSTFAAVTVSANKQLEVKTAELFRSLHEAPEWAGLLVDIKTGKPASAAPASEYQKLGKIAAQEIFDSSYASLDAAVLVFSHSLLDALAFDCCRVTALHAPRDWEQDLKNTQVQLLDMQGKSYDQLLQTKLDDRLKKLERESLLAKVERLFARCKPPSSWSPMKDYLFDWGLVKKLDIQRHEIVHGKALGKSLTIFPVSEESLFYVQRTGMFFMGLVNFRYHLQIDPKYLEPKVI